MRTWRGPLSLCLPATRCLLPRPLRKGFHERHDVLGTDNSVGVAFFVPQPFLPNYDAAVWIVIDRCCSLLLQDHRGVVFPVEVIEVAARRPRRCQDRFG